MKALLLIALVLVASCAKIPKADESRVNHLVHSRLTKRVHWYKSQDEKITVQSAIDQWLEEPLAIDAAVQLALFNNPSIQEAFEELGIAQADLVEAGLFQNPLFDGFIRFPTKSLHTMHAGFSVSQSFLDIFFIPLRKKVAATQLLQSELGIANKVLDLAFDVQKTYYSLQAEERRYQLLETLLETVEATVSIAQEQYQAGNINALSLQKKTGLLLEATLELAKSQTKRSMLHQQLTHLLGLQNRPIRIQNGLPQMTETEYSEKELESLALQHRLDLGLIRLEIKRLLQMGATKKWWAYTNGSAGISSEDASGIGPSLSSSIPLFNHGQTDRSRLLAMLRQQHHRLDATVVEICTQLKMLTDTLSINRKQVGLYLSEYLPLQNLLVTTSQRYYNVMGLSVYKLLQMRQKELKAEIAYISALQDYWLTKIALDHTVGKSL